MPSKPRKPIADLIEDLRSWLPNYDHGPKDYPTVLFRILASAPGGDQLEDMGYEPFNLGWQEIDQLGRVLVAIQDKRDVEDLVEALTGDEEGVEETSRLHEGPSWPAWAASEQTAHDVASQNRLYYGRSSSRTDSGPAGWYVGTIAQLSRIGISDIRDPVLDRPPSGARPRPTSRRSRR